MGQAGAGGGAASDEQAARLGHARQGAADQGPGHRDENSGEPPPREDQGDVGPAQ